MWAKACNASCGSKGRSKWTAASRVGKAVRGALCRGVPLILAIAPVAGQAQTTFPLNIREPAPIGDGYADGKPYDILGIMTGMSGEQAIAIATKHYAQQKRTMKVMVAKLPFNGQEFVSWMRPADSWASSRPEDTLYLAMSSAANKNQVVYIKRHVVYPKDRPANYAETLAALKAKYGEPGSLRVSEAFAQLTYPVQAGVVATTDEKSPPECTAARGALTSNPGANRNGNFGHLEATRLGVLHKCSALMFIELEFARNNGMRNPNAIEEMSITVVDINRTMSATEWDNKEIARLNELARTSGTTGAAPSKL